MRCWLGRVLAAPLLLWACGESSSSTDATPADALSDDCRVFASRTLVLGDFPYVTSWDSQTHTLETHIDTNYECDASATYENAAQFVAESRAVGVVTALSTYTYDEGGDHSDSRTLRYSPDGRLIGEESDVHDELFDITSALSYDEHDEIGRPVHGMREFTKQDSGVGAPPDQPCVGIEITLEYDDVTRTVVRRVKRGTYVTNGEPCGRSITWMYTYDERAILVDMRWWFDAETDIRSEPVPGYWTTYQVVETDVVCADEP